MPRVTAYPMRIMLRMTERLVARIDALAKRDETTRAHWIRDALKRAVAERENGV